MRMDRLLTVPSYLCMYPENVANALTYTGGHQSHLPPPTCLLFPLDRWIDALVVGPGGRVQPRPVLGGRAGGLRLVQLRGELGR